MTRLLLATRNAGKLRELRELTAGSAIDWVALDSFQDVPEAPEDGATFAQNARRKALFYADASGLLTLADDSGLEIDALGGAPGVHSARYAGEPRSDVANNRKVLGELHGISAERRCARFRCAMAFARPGEVLLESAGEVEGRILTEPRGCGGFGYDPLFLIPALGRTAAELPPEVKHAVSHRGQALRIILPRIERWVREHVP